MNNLPGNLLEIDQLSVHFQTVDGTVKAVEQASFTIPRGKTVCVVGESGCGKSVTARAILQVVDAPGKIVHGALRFSPDPATTVDLAALHPRSAEMRAIRGKEIAMIYQEPMSALSPLYSIGNQISEAIRWHLPVSQQEARNMAIESLTKVGIPRPHELIDAYTFELSGGMRQRAMIAMALVCQPKLLIADEPTTALDVTTQASILDLLRDLQQELGMSMMFITHDLGVVAAIAHEVVVMYLGAVVERASVEELFTDPKHPYTRALLRSIPKLGGKRQQRLSAIQGTVPHPLQRPAGCLFHARCTSAVAGTCTVIAPPMIELGETQAVRCLAYSNEHSVTLNEPDTAPTRELTAQETSPRSASQSGRVLLSVRNLKMHFPITSGFFNRVTGHVKAVDGVSFEIYAGETLGLVGESGCGKTTLAHTMIRLYKPTAGEIFYDSSTASADSTAKTNGSDKQINLAVLSDGALKRFRRELRMIFQDPYASLNPRLPVVEIVGEVLRVNQLARGNEVEARVADLLGKVGLSRHDLRRYPHAFSGGQRQRIGIARALASTPRLVIADEPVSALDVSVQAQILNLLKDLQRDFALTYLFVSHDLNVVAHISDRVAVMYVGKIVELAPTEQLFAAPQHPYTEALLSAILPPDPTQRATAQRIRLEGSVADPANPPSGCAFHPRCRYAQARCQQETPTLRQTETEQWVACHFAEELSLRGA